MSATSASADFRTLGMAPLSEFAVPRPPAAAPVRRPPPMTSRQRRETLQFQFILAATYPFFLAAAVSRRLRPAQPPGAGPARPRSVFGEAKEMAVCAIPYVFMG